MPEKFDEAMDTIRDALHRGTDTVLVRLELSRAVAEKLLQLMEAEQSTGAVVVPVKEFYTTTESASFLGMSRATLMKLIESGDIESIKVGSHHRVPAHELLAYQRARETSRGRANELLTEFSSRSTRFHSNVTFRAGHQGQE